MMGRVRGVFGYVLALTAFFWLGGWGFETWGPPRERLERILEIFELHPTRIWALRPNLLTTFEGAPLHTDGEGRRISQGCEGGGGGVWVIGDSLTFGWGVGDDETWPARVQQRLGRKVENAAVPGYTTWQGLTLLRETVLPRAPAVVLVSFGVNDVSKMRFFDTSSAPDSAWVSRGRVATAAWNAVMSTRLWKFARNLAFRRRDGSATERAALLAFSDRTPVRVSADDYAVALRQMTTLCRTAGATVVLVKMPLNLPLPPAVTQEKRDAAAAAFGQAEAAGGASGASDAFRRALDADPTDRTYATAALRHFQAGGDPANVERVLTLMMRQDVWAASALHVAYNQRLDAVARELAVPVVDVEALFVRAGGTLFNDPVTDPYHPNPRGHAVIADAVARTLGAPGMR